MSTPDGTGASILSHGQIRENGPVPIEETRRCASRSFRCSPSRAPLGRTARRSGAAGASRASAATPPATLEVPYRQFQLANGLNVILHRDTSVPIVAVNVWYHVGSANETAGAHRLRAPVRAPDVRGIEEREGRRVRHAARGRRRQQQRLDHQRPHQLRDRRAVERAGAGALPRVRSHGLPARHDVARSASTASATWSRTSGARATRTAPTAWRRSRSTRCCGRPTIPTAGRRSATWRT